MLRRAASEVRPGLIVNLGIGLPTRIPHYLDAAADVLLHSENGVVGIGPVASRGHEDRNLIDAGGLYVTTTEAASYFDSSVSFSMIRAGRVDLTFLGAFQVGSCGDLANWTVPGQVTAGVGGGAELAQKAKRVVVLTRHRDKAGQPKIVDECTMPLTAKGCVDRIITDLAVIDIVDGAATLVEVSETSSIEQVLAYTDAELSIDPDPMGTF